MKSLWVPLVFASLFSISAHAKTSYRLLHCALDVSYGIKANLTTNTIDLWEFAGGLGSPLVEDTIVKKEEVGGILTMQLKKYGTIKLDFNHRYNLGEGQWNHRGLLDKDLVDTDEYSNYGGKAELRECTYEDAKY